MSMRAVLSAGLGAAVLSFGGVAAAQQPPHQQQATPSLEQSVTAEMMSRANLENSDLAERNSGTEVNPQRSSGDWVFGSAVIKAPATAEAPEAWLFVAHRNKGTWQVALDGTPEFQSLAAASPMLSRGEKQTFANNARNARNDVLATKTGLALPFPIGGSWRIIGGLHGWSGQPRPWSSIDLDSRATNREVLAAQSGRAYWMCSNGGHIRIIHDNGWTTEYYHLLNEIKPNGTAVRLGDYLGLTSTRIPCGGSAGSNHVHFALKKDGSWVPMAEKTIGGWTGFEGSSAYGGGMYRGSDYRYTGDWVYNYGPETGGKTFENATNFDIPDLGQVESSITVSGVPGNAPSSLQVYLDIHHTWRGDLQVDLIGPSGAAYRLRNPDPDDDADVIHQTIGVNASSEVANGTWKIRVKDVDDNDVGYIDGWTLTF